MYRSHVLVCGGTGCTSSGSQRIRERLEKEIAANGLSEEVGVVKDRMFRTLRPGADHDRIPGRYFLFHGAGRRYPGDRIRASSEREE